MRIQNTVSASMRNNHLSAYYWCLTVDDFSINIFAMLKPVLLRIYLDTVTVFLCKIASSKCFHHLQLVYRSPNPRQTLHRFFPACTEKSVYSRLILNLKRSGLTRIPPGRGVGHQYYIFFDPFRLKIDLLKCRWRYQT